MKVKIDPADREFSRYIRLRDKRCMRCGRGGGGPEGIHGLQNSHYFGRAKEATRFDPLNCDTLCFGCHQMWGSTDREAYRNWKISQIGEDEHNKLILRANSYKKKDRKMELLKAKALIQQLEGK